MHARFAILDGLILDEVQDFVFLLDVLKSINAWVIVLNLHLYPLHYIDLERGIYSIFTFKLHISLLSLLRIEIVDYMKILKLQPAITKLSQTWLR